MTVRVVWPDHHGSQCDKKAMAAFLADLKTLDPDEVVMLGDHVDASGPLWADHHKRNAIAEIEYSYEKDIEACAAHLDIAQQNAPRAKFYYIEGNHEARIEKFAANTFGSVRDARGFVNAHGPAAKLKLHERGIRYFQTYEKYMGLSIPGTIRLGKIYYTHGITHAKNAADVHLARFGASVIFGHTHRPQEARGRSVEKGGFGAWSPGCLAELQPFYRHTAPTDHQHGYGAQFILDNGNFQHVNVAIVRGQSFMQAMVKALA